ncbi:MAG: M20 family peptidase [Cyclobacteriaceae bacterium]|nr:M20 family peptidase [Cyclobacteriaceae bacterium]
MFKKLLLLIFIALLILVGVVLFNTFTLESKQQQVEALPAPEISEEALKNFQQAISYKTISYADSTLFDSSQFNSFRRFLENTYPNVHTKLTREIVAGYSLLYKWEGKNPTLKPIILMAHQDVVPIEEATKNMWTVDPFGAEVKEGFIWGRGTTDDKINLVSIMEAAKKLLSENFQPERTIYFSFGHDEEIGGKGARAAAALLKSRGIEAEFILDEGGIVTLDKMPGITRPLALLGTSEKGYLSLNLTVEVAGGHSSMPAEETAIDVLNKALVNLRSKPFPSELKGSTLEGTEYIGPEMPFMQKMAFANPWLFKRLILSNYEKSPQSAAMVRTTMVPTIIHAGIKDNVVPTVAKATVNFRLLPGDLSEEIIEEVKRKINDERVKVEYTRAFVSEASAVTSAASVAYQKVDEAIKKSLPETISAPFLMIGATDSRFFGEVSPNIIKFSPMIDPIGFHGIDERVSLDSYKTALWFYEQLIRNSN